MWPGAGRRRATHSSVSRSGRASICCSALRDAGFDATQGTTSLTAVAAPPGRPECEPVQARRALAKMVYLPIYPQLPERELERLVALVGCNTKPVRQAWPQAVGYPIH